MVSFVSHSSEYFSIAVLIWSSCLVAIGGSFTVLMFLIPWYAVAWFRAESFTSYTKNSSGICRSIWSSQSLFVPSLASLSLSLFLRFL